MQKEKHSKERECGVKGCNRKRIDTFDYWTYELGLCEDGLRHIDAAQLLVAFAQGRIVPKSQMDALWKSETLERIFSPWEEGRDKDEEEGEDR